MLSAGQTSHFHICLLLSKGTNFCNERVELGMSVSSILNDKLLCDCFSAVACVV